MKYQNAAVVLPEEVLRNLQDYFQGGLLYIPKADVKTGWGCKSGAKDYYARRNRQIRDAYAENISIEELAGRFGLSECTIRKIIYQ